MESVYNFEMAGKWWSDEEDLKLLKHYNEDGLNVVQIAKLRMMLKKRLKIYKMKL